MLLQVEFNVHWLGLLLASKDSNQALHDENDSFIAVFAQVFRASVQSRLVKLLLHSKFVIHKLFDWSLDL